MKLWQKVLVGIAFGIIAEHFLGKYETVLEVFNICGQMFMRLIKMLMGPLIFCVLSSGILGVSDIKSFGYTGFKIIFFSLFNTLCAVVVGICIANWIEPGKNFNISLFRSSSSLIEGQFDIGSFICNFVPENVFQSFTQCNLLQMVFFAVFVGIISQLHKKHYSTIKENVGVVSEILFFMMEKIMYLSPYGAFLLTAFSIGIQGIDILFALGRLIGALLLTMNIQYMLFGLSINIFCIKPPFPFYRTSFTYQVLAFSISSSTLVLPKTIKICQDSLGVSDFGASQIYDIDLSFQHYCYIILLSTIGAIGAAGVPGLTLIMLPVVLKSISIPTDNIALLLSIDRLLDMLRTTLNITGDVATAIIIDHEEKKINYDVYYK